MVVLSRCQAHLENGHGIVTIAADIRYCRPRRMAALSSREPRGAIASARYAWPRRPKCEVVPERFGVDASRTGWLRSRCRTIGAVTSAEGAKRIPRVGHTSMPLQFASGRSVRQILNMAIDVLIGVWVAVSSQSRQATPRVLWWLIPAAAVGSLWYVTHSAQRMPEPWLRAATLANAGFGYVFVGCTGRVLQLATGFGGLERVPAASGAAIVACQPATARGVGDAWPVSGHGVIRPRLTPSRDGLLHSYGGRCGARSRPVEAGSVRGRVRSGQVGVRRTPSGVHS